MSFLKYTMIKKLFMNLLISMTELELLEGSRLLSHSKWFLFRLDKTSSRGRTVLMGFLILLIRSLLEIRRNLLKSWDRCLWMFLNLLANNLFITWFVDIMKWINWILLTIWKGQPDKQGVTLINRNSWMMFCRILPSHYLKLGNRNSFNSWNWYQQ